MEKRFNFMKEETKHSIKQSFETLGIAVICTFFVLSMHQGCSGVSEGRSSNKKTLTVKKAEEIKNDTVNTFKLEQRAR
jgi:hypothetical protein